jgi:hypothetical protein
VSQFDQLLRFIKQEGIMLRKWVLATILAGTWAAMATAQSAPKFLTNDDVVSMVKAGHDVDTILTAIQTQGTDFDVSAKALLQLKKSGVPKKVIDAMIGAVKDQKEAAAAVLSASQAKIAASEAEDAAEEAKAEAAKAARAKAAAAMAAAAPGQPSVVVVQGAQRQSLAVSHTQIVPTKTQASSLDGLAMDGSLTQNLSSVAQMLGKMGPMGGMGGGGMKPGSSMTSMLFMANPILGPAMMAGSLLAKHKAASAPMTDVWAIPGVKSDTVVHESQTMFEVQFDGIAGINADEYEPVLVKLQPSQSNFRLVGATTATPSEMQGSEANWDIYASFVEQRVATQATKVASGRYQLQAAGGLAPGEYGVVLRPLNKAKKFSGSSVSQNVGDGLVFNCVWSFQVQ